MTDNPISASIRASLAEFRPILERHVDGILEMFYQRIAADPHLRSRFPSPEAMKHARSKQRTHWLDYVFSDSFGSPAYQERVLAIGHAHVRVGLEPRPYIDGYRVAYGQLLRLAVQTWRKRPDKLERILEAINEAVFTDMGLSVQAYMQVAREQTRKAVNGIADTFDADVAGMVAAVSSAATELHANAETMSGAADRAASGAAGVASGSAEASSNVATVAAATEELSASVAEITRQVAEAANTAKTGAGKVDRANTVMGDLSRAAQRIGEVVKLIEGIAGQVNLLALNATIEAARAGEAGKGFAVVATEVKTLARRVAEATQTIAAQVAGVQSEVGKAVGAIGDVAATIGQLDAISAAIAAAVEQQDAAAREISRNIQHAAEGAAQVNRNVTVVMAAAEDTSGVAGNVVEAANLLSRQANDLHNAVDRFLHQVRRSA